MAQIASKSTNVSRAERIQWLDYAKGIGISLVVFGHTLRGLFSNSILEPSGLAGALDRWIYAFHMPLFFFLSGLLIHRSTSKPLPIFLIEKLKTIAYPYFLWSLLQGILQVIASRHTTSKTSLTELGQITYLPIAQFWFLYVLFLLMLIYAIARKLGTSPLLFFVLSVAFYYTQGLVSLGSWGVLYQVRIYIIAFAVGALVGSSLKLSQWQNIKNSTLIGILLAGFLAVGLGVAFNLTDNPYINPKFALGGITASLALAILLYQWNVAHFVAQWGRLSLQIFVAHTIASALLRIGLQKVFNFSEPITHLILGTAIGIYAPIALELICRKVKFRYMFTLR